MKIYKIKGRRLSQPDEDCIENFFLTEEEFFQNKNSEHELQMFNKIIVDKGLNAAKLAFLDTRT